MSVPWLQPVTLEGEGVRLEPLRLEHADEIRALVQDGELWRLRYTTAPEPENARAYVEKLLADQAAGTRLAFLAREIAGGRAVGSTTYHDVVANARRVEIGSTFYAQSWQRTFVNTACKWHLMRHAFETLECPVVGWRTDILNTRSQAAIERLGAKKDGIIRRAILRRDGTLRDTVMYSVTAEEWREGVRARMLGLLRRV
ncbi:MAG TPA: GNAT family N-acetyltransferase [Opitutaceae bacterium]|jgi:RimJ/RimL family protein N-acetyltransferase